MHQHGDAGHSAVRPLSSNLELVQSATWHLGKMAHVESAMTSTGLLMLLRLTCFKFASVLGQACEDALKSNRGVAVVL